MTGLDSHLPDPVPDPAFDPWNFRPDVAVEVSGAKLADYQVDAVDGKVGSVTDSALDPDQSYLAVSTGKVFGRTVLVPAGTVNHIDHSERTVYLDRTRDQVKQAPEVPAEAYRDPAQREQVADYYRQTF